MSLMNSNTGPTAGGLAKAAEKIGPEKVVRRLPGESDKDFNARKARLERRELGSVSERADSAAATAVSGSDLITVDEEKVLRMEGACEALFDDGMDACVRELDAKVHKLYLASAHFDVFKQRQKDRKTDEQRKAEIEARRKRAQEERERCFMCLSSSWC